MPNLPESAEYAPGIYQYEADDPIEGGGPDAYDNIVPLQLANRTAWLKGAVDRLKGAVVNVMDYGATGAGDVDDSVAIRAAFAAVQNGGTIYFPKPAVAYRINQSIGLWLGTGLVHVKGDGALIRQEPTVNPYSMFYYRENMVIEGIELEGYVESGTGWADVVPQTSFGFRADPGAKDVVFIGCIAHGLPFEGWYADAEDLVIRLIGCAGYDNYRNDFAAVGARSVLIDGGTWGADTHAINKVNTIDIEPDAGTSVEVAIVRNLTAHHIVNFYGANGRIGHGEAEGLVFDGAAAGLAWLRVADFMLGEVAYRNGAKLRGAGVLAGGVGSGRFRTRSGAAGPNLVPSPYNSTVGWTLYSDGATTRTPNVAVGDRRGVRLTAVAGAATNYSAVMPVVPGKTYSFGALMKATVVGGSQQGVWLFVAGTIYYLQHTDTATPGRIAGAVTIPAGVNEVTLLWGSDQALAFDCTFTDIFFCEGLVGALDVERRSAAAAAPASGTWKPGDVVWHSAPGFADPLGWVCVVAGTPGTWLMIGGRGTGIADAAGGATVDAEARAAINALLAVARAKQWLA